MNYLHQISAVAGNTIKESLRNRIVYALMGITAVVMGISLVLGWVSITEEHKLKVVIDFSLSSMVLFGTLTSIFLGTNLIYQEVERRTVYTLLARPITRAQFILGKFFGLVAVNAICLSAMTLIFMLVFLAKGGVPNAVLFAAIYLIFLELAVVTGVAVLFSVTAHPIEGAVFAFVVALAGHFTRSLLDLAEEMTRDGKGEALAQAGVKLLSVVYLILPNLDYFNLRSEAANQVPVPLDFLFSVSGYAVLYCTVLVLLAVWSFGRRSL